MDMTQQEAEKAMAEAEAELATTVDKKLLVVASALQQMKSGSPEYFFAFPSRVFSLFLLVSNALILFPPAAPPCPSITSPQLPPPSKPSTSTFLLPNPSSPPGPTQPNPTSLSRSTSLPPSALLKSSPPATPSPSKPSQRKTTWRSGLFSTLCAGVHGTGRTRWDRTSLT